jgi:hypothetical protein
MDASQKRASRGRDLPTVAKRLATELRQATEHIDLIPKRPKAFIVGWN